MYIKIAPYISLTTGVSENFSEGYFVIDSNIGYAINKLLSVSLAVKNVTNTEYMGCPGDIQPQRNISLRRSGKL